MTQTMKTILFLNHKGGVGKTTITYNVAMLLANWGKRVLMLDTDAQASLTILCGLRPQGGMYDLIARHDSTSWSTVIRKIGEEQHGGTGVVGLVPGNWETSNLDNLRDVYIVRERIEELINDFDFVLVDSPPTPSKVHLGLYLAADGVAYPTELELLSIQSLISSLQVMSEANKTRFNDGLPGLEVVSIIPNMYRTSTNEHNDNLTKLQEKFGGLVSQPIPLATAIPEAARNMKPLFLHQPNHSANSIFADLAMRLIELEVQRG